MLQKIRVENLRPNPFRRLDEYPIQREKVDALKKSIDTTGFWGTIVGRPADEGFVEIAFGHHRLVAIQECYKPKDAVEIIVRELSNEDMLRMMANENLEEYRSSGWVELETVRATIEAARQGSIKLPDADARGGHSKVLSHICDLNGYTRASVARFLGWTRKNNGDGARPDLKCEIAFLALEAIDDGLIKEADLKDLSRWRIQETVNGLRRIHNAEKEVAKQNRKAAEQAKERAATAPSPTERRRYEKQAEVYEEQADQHEADAVSKANDFGKTVAEQSRNGNVSVKEIRSRAAEVAPTVERPRNVPNVNDLADKVIRKMAGFINGEDDLSGYLNALEEFKGELSSDAARRLCQESAALRSRLTKIENVFRGI